MKTRFFPIEADLEISNDLDITTDLEISTEFDAEIFEFFGSSNVEYHGEYEVTPTLDTQTLHTAHLAMERDVVVYPIPIEEIPNEYGGVTLWIARPNNNEGD